MNNNQWKKLSKRSGVYLLSIVFLFVSVGILTTVQPAYRLSSDLITEWTRDIDGSVFYRLFGMENRAFTPPDDQQLPNLSEVVFQVATNLKPNDPRSLLGNEIPGFSIYDNEILIAGEGTDYTNLPVESNPPLDEVLKDREAIEDEVVEEKKPEGEEELDIQQSTGDKEVVFIYNTHNRESFLPYLPDVTNPDSAHHSEMNITKVSDRLAEALEQKGIGTYVDDTDIGTVLNEKGMDYTDSYTASRDVVEEAFATNKDLQFVFDIHRDSLRKDATTKEINGESYARIMFVVGTDHPDYEKNLKIATELNHLVEEKYPGLSRGVIPQGGAGNNGVYNQDLSGNSILLEVGGVDNTMEELYRSADAFADVFSAYYWQAEEVQSNP